MSDQPEALRVADELEALRVSDAREMWLLGEPAARLLREQHAEIQELREANETFGKRQEWWNEKMFDMELEVERLREQLRLANIDASNEAAENEALRRDAERYRWLRDKAPPDIGDMASVRDSHDPSEIDAAIDAAMGDKP